nr:ribonuclease H-like domain-containing protein [Tanacetum cinerariifolium]
MEYWITNIDMYIWKESKARTTLLQSNPDDHVVDFHYMDDARDICNAVKARFGGNVKSKKMRKSMPKQEFLEFKIGEAEGLHKGYDRIQKIMSQLNQLKAKPEDEDINLKGNDKQRYSSFKIKEIGKKEEDSKSLITVDTLVDWTDHNGESDGVITSKEFGMIAGCDTEDAIEE